MTGLCACSGFGRRRNQGMSGCRDGHGGGLGREHTVSERCSVRPDTGRVAGRLCGHCAGVPFVSGFSDRRTADNDVVAEGADGVTCVAFRTAGCILLVLDFHGAGVGFTLRNRQVGNLVIVRVKVLLTGKTLIVPLDARRGAGCGRDVFVRDV